MNREAPFFRTGSRHIKPGVPHEVFNIGQEELVVFVARSTADEWDKIINYPSKYRPAEGG